MSSTAHEHEKESEEGTPVGTLRGKGGADGKTLEKEKDVGGVRNVQLDFGDEVVRFRRRWWQLWCIPFDFEFDTRADNPPRHIGSPARAPRPRPPRLTTPR
jgi:hypothetical protein